MGFMPPEKMTSILHCPSFLLFGSMDPPPKNTHTQQTKKYPDYFNVKKVALLRV
jgi:hypothetical protein